VDFGDVGMVVTLSSGPPCNHGGDPSTISRECFPGCSV
jgi:hypothetical protein